LNEFSQNNINTLISAVCSTNSMSDSKVYLISGK
jgi:hypothetical protein